MSQRSQRDARRRVLSELLRGLRAQKKLRIPIVAARMGLETRSYERFEAGEVRPDLDRLLLFAEAVDCDPAALLTALLLLRPEVAFSSADNKLGMVLALGLERFVRRLGVRVRRLETSLAIDVIDEVFDRLEAELDAKEARTRSWFRERDDDA